MLKGKAVSDCRIVNEEYAHPCDIIEDDSKPDTQDLNFLSKFDLLIQLFQDTSLTVYPVN